MINITNDISSLEILNGSFTPTIQAYYFVLWKGFSMNMHRHNRFEIMYVLDGECTIICEDKISHILKKGMFIVVNSNYYHKLLIPYNDSCRMLNIEFSFESLTTSNLIMRDLTYAFPRIISLASTIKNYRVFKDTANIGSILKNIILLKENKEACYFINTYISQLFIKLSIIGHEENNAENIFVLQAEEFIRLNYDRNIKVSEIAKYININESYFYKIFKNSKGITPIEYLTKFRINLAKRMLNNTSLTLSEICDYIGMGSRQYFSNCFKKNEGISPTEYRQKARISFNIDEN